MVYLYHLQGKNISKYSGCCNYLGPQTLAECLLGVSHCARSSDKNNERRLEFRVEIFEGKYYQSRLCDFYLKVL